MMKYQQKWILLICCLLILSGCSLASVDGQLNVKVNADGSGQYQFTVLTHPATLKYFQKYQTQLREQDFQIVPISKGEQQGWRATKQVDHLLKEPLPLSITTSANTNMEQAVKVTKGFYQTQIQVNYPLDLTHMTEESPLILLIKDRIRLKLVVTLPVEFEQQNATTLSNDKKTATWQLKVGEINPLQAQVTVPNPVGWLITIVAGSILLLLLLISIIVIFRKRRNRY